MWVIAAHMGGELLLWSPSAAPFLGWRGLHWSRGASEFVLQPGRSRGPPVWAAFPVCSVLPAPSPPQRDENPVGSDTRGLLTLPLSPEHRKHFNVPVAPAGSRQQSDKSRSEDAQVVSSLTLCLLDPLPCPSSAVPSDTALGAAPSTSCNPCTQSLLWNLHIFISRGDAISSLRECFQRQCSIPSEEEVDPNFVHGCLWSQRWNP